MAWRLFGAKPLSKPMLGYCHWTLSDKLQWNYFNQDILSFIQENSSENIVCEMVALLPGRDELTILRKIVIDLLDNLQLFYWYIFSLSDIDMTGSTQSIWKIRFSRDISSYDANHGLCMNGVEGDKYMNVTLYLTCESFTWRMFQLLTYALRNIIDMKFYLAQLLCSCTMRATNSTVILYER